MLLVHKIHHQLIEQKKTIALAESCTGGHLASWFTSIPDASKYFVGSIVAYSNSLKRKLLQVSQETLLQHGAVSRNTADEMLLGLMKLTEADYGIAITGIAGPNGETKEKPVGTVFIALGEKGKKPHLLECHFSGDRLAVIQATCEKALLELSQMLIF